MKQTINSCQFVDAFIQHDRFNQFGRPALNLLFDYFEELENDTGEEMELDVIAICCDYSVDDCATIAQDYSIDIEDMDEDEAKDAVLEYLQDNTTVIGECDDGIVYCTSF